MSIKQYKDKNYITIGGTGTYPWLTVADTKYNKYGQFKVKLHTEYFGNEETFEKLNTILENFSKSYVEKDNKVTIAKIYIPETNGKGIKSDKVVMQFKLNKIIKTNDGSFEQKPKLLDANMDEYYGDIYSNCKINMNAEIIPYFSKTNNSCGLSFRIKAVQVLNAGDTPTKNEVYGFAENNPVDKQIEDDNFGFNKVEAETDSIPF